MQQDNNFIEVKALDPSEANSLLRRPGHLFYHPDWLAVLMQQYGYRFWMSCGPGDEYLLLAQVKGLLGAKLVSLPFSDYTVPHVAPEKLPLHIAALQRVFPTYPIVVKCAEIYATPHELRFLGEPVSNALMHRVQIDEYTDSRMSASFRRGVRKALKNKLYSQVSRNPESLRRFYELFYHLRTEKLGLIPQPFTFFELVFEQFILKGEGFIYEVKQGDEVLASAIILKEGNALYYKWGCSCQERLYLRPNNLLFYDLIRLASQKGCQYLDLGLSDLDEKRGLIRFKNNMGGNSSAIYTYVQNPLNYPLALEKQLKGLINDVADMVVQYKLSPADTQAFSQALYPLFV